MANSGTRNGACTTTDAPTSRTNLGIAAAALLTAPVGVSDGGTGLTAITGSSVFLGNGTSAWQAVTPGANGRLFIGSSSGNPTWALPTSPDTSITITPGNGSLTIVTPIATTSQLGTSVLASASQAVTGTNTANYVCPSTLTSRFAAPGAIGGTAPGLGIFTNVVLTTSSGPQINTGSGAPSASVPKGSMYMRTDGSSTVTRGYIATDAVGTYTAFVTVT